LAGIELMHMFRKAQMVISAENQMQFMRWHNKNAQLLAY
jgi:hypothetical protein